MEIRLQQWTGKLINLAVNQKCTSKSNHQWAAEMLKSLVIFLLRAQIRARTVQSDGINSYQVSADKSLQLWAQTVSLKTSCCCGCRGNNYTSPRVLTDLSSVGTEFQSWAVYDKPTLGKISTHTDNSLTIDWRFSFIFKEIVDVFNFPKVKQANIMQLIKTCRALALLYQQSNIFIATS